VVYSHHPIVLLRPSIFRHRHRGFASTRSLVSTRLVSQAACAWVAIVNYAEVALESPLGLNSRDHLLKIYDESESLIREANDLTKLFTALQ
jgi:hypothetical protein